MGNGKQAQKEEKGPQAQEISDDKRDFWQEMCSDEPVLFLDPPSAYDNAILGVVHSPARIVYSAELIVEALLTEDMTEEEAWEYFYFNIEGAYVGTHTPLYVFTGREIFVPPADDGELLC